MIVTLRVALLCASLGRIWELLSRLALDRATLFAFVVPLFQSIQACMLSEHTTQRCRHLATNGFQTFIELASVYKVLKVAQC